MKFNPGNQEESLRVEGNGNPAWVILLRGADSWIRHSVEQVMNRPSLDFLPDIIEDELFQ